MAVGRATVRRASSAVALAIVAGVLISLFAPTAMGELEFVRPPPRPIIDTLHTKDDAHPQQVHISAVGSNHMRITYITDNKSVPSMVEYGRSPGKYDSSATGESTSYRYFFYTSGKIHHVKIGPLEPGMVYYYRCGGIGGEFSFKTPPSSLPIEFAIIGDLGQTEWTAATLLQANRRNYDMLLLPGDLSYADGQQPLWDTFGRFVEPQASRRPWMVTEGNHEIEALPVVKCHSFASYNARWRMPHEESGSSSNLYYSFDAAGGAVHVLMLGSYTDYDAASEQYRWLAADLARIDRARTPWLVALLHAPWYNTNTAHQGEGEDMRKAVEKLLYDARVDAIFAGHVHAYERFTRIYNNTADPCGPVHITIGDGGNREGLALRFDKSHKLAKLSAFQEASFGHGRLKVVNGTHAHWSWHRNDDADSIVGDQFWLGSLSASRACRPPPVSALSSSLPAAPARDEL